MFADRFDAGQQLAEQLKEYKDNKDVIVLAIPRGALEIGFVLAKELNVPLDVIFAKKIGAPGQPELAIGAVSMKHQLVAPEFAQHPAIQKLVEQRVKEIRALLAERIKKYRGDKLPLDLKDKIVIVTDDGVATGRTLMLTLQLIKQHNPKKIIVAVPVGPRGTIEQLKKQADQVVVPLVPDSFFAISQFYKNFQQVEDETAIDLLKRANA